MPISVVFDPPLPSDSPSTFNTKAFTLLGDLNDWSTQANALPGEVATNLSALLAAPPAIGSTTPAAGSFTALSVSTGPDGISVGPGTGTSTRANIKFKGTDAVGVSVPWVVGSNIVSTDGSLDFYNGGLRSCLSTTGLAVTGTLSVTKSGAGYQPAMLSFATPTETSAVYRIGMGGGSLIIGRTDTSTTNVTLDASGNLTLSAGTLGYGTGAGGTVTQATSKSTAVTLNKPSGQITMNNEALAAGASVAFALNNTFFATTDTVVLTGLAWSFFYRIETANSATWQIGIRVTNTDSVSRSDPLAFSFAIVKGATS
jgi:hypothetical protein